MSPAPKSRCPPRPVLFNSYVFLFAFLPVLLAVYYGVLRTTPQRNAWLVFTSYVFYGWWNPLFCLLMLASTASDYVIGKQIHRTESPRRRRLWIVLTVGLNLAVLGFFKYYNFLAESLNHALGWLQLAPLAPGLDIVLPIGISFYTFESLSYTIDIYRREVKPANNFVDFLCFISLFPHLVAGPIMRYADLDRQLRDRTHTTNKFMLGVIFLAAGLLKKLVLADTVAPVADALFDQATNASVTDAWTGVVAYTLQIYFDFSAYSDMAYGLGLMIGFELVQNFDSPYQSVSIQDFWRRWHISLSTWLRDYLYKPLGGNRRGAHRTYVNLMIVMLLGGLWHGASWTFVAWGLYHGSLLAIERWLGDRHPLQRAPDVLRRAITLLLVMVGWVFFRSADFATAWRILQNMAGVVTSAPVARNIVGNQAMFALSASIAIALFLPNLRQRPPRVSFATAVASGLAISIALILIGARTTSPFLYFQF